MARLALTAAAVLAALALASPALAGNWSYTYTDAAGDSGTAPDISTVQIGSDDDGLIVIRIAAPNLPTDTSSVTSVFIDADESTTTGDPNASGADYEIDSSNSDEAFYFTHWNQV